MSSYHSDKCSKEELLAFKAEVLEWLNKNFPDWNKKFKLKSFRCYDGDLRLYNGEHIEYTNKKSSFRRQEANKDEQGNIIGWNGTRGKHLTIIAEYITINRDEFQEIKKSLKKGKGDNWYFNDDLIFSRLK